VDCNDITEQVSGEQNHYVAVQLQFIDPAGRLAPASEVASQDDIPYHFKIGGPCLFKMVRYVLLRPLRPELVFLWTKYLGNYHNCSTLQCLVNSQ
jgi:hypothetical protein